MDYYRFGPISINFKRDDRKITKNLYVITRGTSINPICLCPAEYRKGKIRLGQNLYEVAVIDGNFDGLYGSVFSPPIDNFFRPGCDSFFIDKNWNGRPDFSLYQRSELMPLTKMVKLGNDYYDIDVNPKGTTLELKKVIPELGTLDLGGAKVKLKLCSDAAEQFLLPHEKEYRIPAGRYTVSYMDLDEKDDQGDIWTAICYRDTGQLRDFEIRSDQNTSFKIGSPFQVMVSAKQVTNAFSINFYLEGRSGEHYNPDIRKNGRRVSPAIIKIVDEAGEVIETGRFEYG